MNGPGRTTLPSKEGRPGQKTRIGSYMGKMRRIEPDDASRYCSKLDGTGRDSRGLGLVRIGTSSTGMSILARLDDRLERVGVAREDRQAQGRFAVVGAESAGGVEDIGSGRLANDPAAETLEHLLDRREVGNGCI